MRARYPVIVVALLALTMAAHAAAPAVQKLLPANGAVKGFTIFAKSLQYGRGNDISKIYDGGFELYTNNGVIDAARQMYQRGGEYMEVTVHTMKSDKAALDFLKYWQKEMNAKALVKTKASTGFVVTKPNVMAYFVTGKYLTTISAFYPAAKATKDIKAFQAVIEKATPR